MRSSAPKPDPLLSRIQAYLPGALPNFLRAQRWFAGKAHAIRSVSLLDIVPIPAQGLSAYVILARVDFETAKPQVYALPLVALPRSDPQGRPEADATGGETPLSGRPILILEATGEISEYRLEDGFSDGIFARLLVEMIREKLQFRGVAGEITATPAPPLEELWVRGEGTAEPAVMKGEQTNTSVRYGERCILKFYRRLEEGVNLDQEIGSFLTGKTGFKYTPPFAGAIEYRRAGRPSGTMAILQGFVRNQGDAWQYTLSALGEFVGHVKGRPSEPAGSAPWLISSPRPLPALAEELLGSYLNKAELLGKRTAELHVALASDAIDADFAPESFSEQHMESMVRSMVSLASAALGLLRERMETLPAASREKAHRVVAEQDGLLSRFYAIRELRDTGMRTRIHGDYHLGQVLVTSDDFAIIDFEGEPERPLSERRLKRSPLRDVAGMLRSFHYAASSTRIQKGLGEGETRVARWLQHWRNWVSAAFLEAYLRGISAGAGQGVPLLPDGRDDLLNLLQIFLLEKAAYELGYELNNRPGWVEIPLDGLLDLL